MKKIYQIIYPLFWLAAGGLFGIELIVLGVTSPEAKAETAQGLAIYNLLDHVLPYTLVFLIISVVLLLYLIIFRSKVRD